MKRTKGDETPLRVQGQERVSGRMVGVQRAAGPLRRGPEVKPLGRVQGDNACSGVQRVKPLAQ